ncbi:AI-2E family transporter [Candidatus Margulisiibacteriota bacterium]
MPSVFNWLRARKRTLKSRKGLKLSPVAKTVVWVLFGIVIFLILKYLGNIIYPFLWALITAYLFSPLIFFLEKKSRLPRAIWIILVYFLLGLLIYWGLSVLIPVVNTELTEFISAPSEGTGFLSRFYQAGKGTFLGFEINYRDIISQVQKLVIEKAPTFALPFFLKTIERFLLILLYLVFTFYLLLDGERYIRLMLMLIPTKYRKEVTKVANDINETLGAYIRGLVILIFIMGFDAWIFLAIFQVDYAILLAVLTGILEIIPLIGPVAATILVALVALYQPVVAYGLSNMALAAILIVIYFILRQIEDYLIIPAVVGKFIHVHPLIVIFAILIGAKAGGILGVFLALPVAAVLKILFYYFYPKLAE